MIYLGLKDEEKIEKITEYARENGIKHIVIFSGEIGGQVTNSKIKKPSADFHLDIKAIADVLDMQPLPYTYGGEAMTTTPDRTVEKYGWADCILYRVFYKLLGRIDSTYLIVINEFMRSKNTSALEYNCIEKYTGQTPHIMTFEYFPVIDDKKDFMMLVNLDTSKRFKSVSLNDMDFSLIHVEGIRRQPELTVDEIQLTDKDKDTYRKKVESLFDNLGNKDPDTIPREIHVWTGKYKKKEIKKEEKYIARNARFKMDNVTTYDDVTPGEQYKIIDFCHRRLSFNDYLKMTGAEKIEYISTGLSIDEVYINQYKEWKKECEYIYDKTGL